MASRNARKPVSQSISRRRFVATSAVVGSAAWLAACGGDSGTKQTTSAPTTAASTAAAGASASPAPAAEKQRGGIVRTTEAAVYDSVDPHRAFGDPTSRLANQIQSKLVWYKNPDTGEIEPDISQSYEAPDGATYTFKLRQGVKWQNRPPVNGREFVADDVRWHFERQANGKLKDGSDASFRFQSIYKTITKIETPDKYTIKLTLDKPNGSFLDQLSAYTATIPNRETTEQFEADHRTLNENAMVGTGPFILQEWRSGKDVKYRRNPDYFRKDEPLVDGMLATVLFEDANAQRAAFEQKQLDTFSSPDPTITRGIITANKGAMYESLSGVSNTVFLSLNMNRQFKDLRLVQAMNMAIDRRALIQAFHQGLGQVSGPVTWLQEGFALPGDELIKVNGYRTDREAEKRDARALWAAGGGAALGEVDIKVPDTWLARWPDTPQIIIKMFNDNLGVTQFKSTKTSYNEEIIPNLFNGNFPNWFGWTSEVNSPDPRPAVRSTFLSTSTSNFNKVNNPALDTLINDVVTLTDRKAAVAKMKDVQKILTDNAQYGQVVLYNYIGVSAFWNYYNANLKVRPSAGKPANGYNLFAGHLIGSNAFLNTKDPSYSGRPPATL